jgi:SAM-dependent methyltransferase
MGHDLFSKQSEIYPRFRPRYPAALYAFLLKNVPTRDFAWDCATGNGQAAVDLSPSFKKVIATDLSRSQIGNAIPARNVEYRVLRAEASLEIPDHSLDLITVAQAIHWFNLPVFYAECERLLKPEGLLATWAYSFHLPISPKIDKVLTSFYFETLGPYWKPENKLIWNGYRDLPFPFTQIEAPKIRMSVEWNLEDLMGYFRTWSATQLFIEATGSDPTFALFQSLRAHWGVPEKPKTLSWGVTLLAGKPNVSGKMSRA